VTVEIPPEQLTSVLVTDCGSTTTKALLFEKTQQGWRHTTRGESPTTVERPVADVTVGVRNAFREVEELRGQPLLKSDFRTSSEYPVLPKEESGIDLYLSTSSAGGGLQMVVSGVVNRISAESAERAALGAGAIVMERFATDDGREDHERVARLRHLRPDIILAGGGFNGGARGQVIEQIELIKAAAPRPRFGATLKLPLIYAGNPDLVDEIKAILDEDVEVSVVANVRPNVGEEFLDEAREAIHELFLTHVMSHSPGYSKLLSWSPVPIMPTPAAVGDMVQAFASSTSKQVLCVDIGGATTDVFSVFRNRDNEPIFHRTVSANLGMSYSVANVLLEAGVENIIRWLPYEASPQEVKDVLRNKMVRPTSIPQTLRDLWLEQAVCREALRLSLAHHKSFAIGISSSSVGGISSIFSQASLRYELIDMRTLDIVIGSGGVLSHAPSRLAAALMMIEGFGLEGVTELCVDSVFMMPHLGVLSSVHSKAALEVFYHDCIVSLGVSVVPLYSAKLDRNTLAQVYLNDKKVGVVVRGKVQFIGGNGETAAQLRVVPLHGSVDVGAGRGREVEREVNLGVGGIILDGRGRPLVGTSLSVKSQQQAYRELGLLEIKK
jgi:uncharacterized protein (TIGR01319 family)